MYWPSTVNVAWTVKDVELLNVTVSATYQIPVEGFKNSTWGTDAKFDPVIVIEVWALGIVSG